MNKKVIIIIVAVLVLLVGGYVAWHVISSALPDDINPIFILNPSTPLRVNPIVEDNVGMTITSINRNDNSVVVTIYNNSDYMVTIGYNFGIEIFDEHGWLTLPIYTPFIAIAIMLAPNDDPINFTKDLNATDVYISPGRYRIRKSLSISEYADTTNFGAYLGWHDIVAEFYFN